MSTTLVRALISHCNSVFYGPNGDYAAVLEAIEKLPVKKALWKPTRGQNSIWQIVDHLMTSKAWQIAMIDQQKLPSLDWIEPAGDEAAWQATLSRLKDAHQKLILRLEKLTDAELLAIPDPKIGQTLLQLILSSGPAHEAHHSGQLDYLRGMQT